MVPVRDRVAGQVRVENVDPWQLSAVGFQMRIKPFFADPSLYSLFEVLLELYDLFAFPQRNIRPNFRILMPKLFHDVHFQFVEIQKIPIRHITRIEQKLKKKNDTSI